MSGCNCGNDQPPLEKLLDFPCDYQFKAFGPNDPAFAAEVRRAAETILPVPLDCIKSRPSGQASYQCVTLLVRLQNIGQLRGIYTALQQVNDLKYLL